MSHNDSTKGEKALGQTLIKRLEEADRKLLCLFMSECNF